jgi:predicted dehydrogenase
MTASHARPIRWGILGTGTIASKFANDLAPVPEIELHAVGSRDRIRAAEFAKRFGIAVSYGGHEALVEDPDIDVVYIALPHPWHYEGALLALRAGKAVLCEKPLTVNATDARDLVRAARRDGRFLMEAMWTRFLPSMRRVREILDLGILGEIRSVSADLGCRMPRADSNRFYSPDLGGGALLDLGIYLISFASFVLGAPESVIAIATETGTGVDAQCSVLLGYSTGAHAILSTTIAVDTPGGAVVAGEDARLEIGGPLFDPPSVRVIRGPNPGAEVVEDIRLSDPGHGWHYEAREVNRCLRSSLLESPVMPLDESVSIMETMDEVRRQIGLRYPFEG